MPKQKALWGWAAETVFTMERFSPEQGHNPSLVAFPKDLVPLYELTQCCSGLESGVNSALNGLFVPIQARAF